MKRQSVNEGLGIPNEKAMQLYNVMVDTMEASASISEAMERLITMVPDPKERVFVMFKLGTFVTEARSSTKNVVAIKVRKGERPTLEQIMEAICKQESLGSLKGDASFGVYGSDAEALN